MLFKEIIAQTAGKNILRRFVDNERIPHAILLLAPSGSGGLSLARATAQYVLCEHKKNGDACGVCNHCTKAQKLIHPDVHYSYPTVGPKTIATNVLNEWRAAILENPYLNIEQWLQKLGAENKQGNIPVAECADIQAKLSLKTFEAPYKILIMWLPEYLGKEGNRLLKLMEEPPDNTIFILVAEKTGMLLDTILSRCQLVKINALSDNDIAEALVKEKNLDSEKAENIARLSDGNFNTALLLAQELENDNARLFLEWMRKCYSGNGNDLVQWVEKFSIIGREQQKTFLTYALHFFRELLLLIATGNENLRLPPEELKTARNMRNVFSVEKIEKISVLLSSVFTYVERNAQPKILFLDTAIQMHKLMKGV